MPYFRFSGRVEISKAVLAVAFFIACMLQVAAQSRKLTGNLSGSISGAEKTDNTTVCTDPGIVRYLRVAIHFLLREETYTETIKDDCNAAIPPYDVHYSGPGNFTETDDGVGTPDYNGFMHAENVIWLANKMLANNQQQWRKTPGVMYPEIPPSLNLQYLLVGVYFHRDNAAFKPGAGQNIHRKYDVDSNRMFAWAGISAPDG